MVWTGNGKLGLTVDLTVLPDSADSTAHVSWTVVRGARYIVRATVVQWHRSTALECGLWCAWFAFLHITSPVESRCLQLGRSPASSASDFESTGHQSFQSFLSCFCPAQTVLLIARLVHPVSGTWRVPGLEDDTRVLQLADLPEWINTLGIGCLSADFPLGLKMQMQCSLLVARGHAGRSAGPRRTLPLPHRVGFSPWAFAASYHPDPSPLLVSSFVVSSFPSVVTHPTRHSAVASRRTFGITVL